MSDSPPSEIGRIVWHDLMTTDLTTARTFYSRLFGWKTKSVEMGELGPYTVVINSFQEIGGMVPLDPEDGITSHWIGYATVRDVDAAVEEVRARQGSVHVDPVDVPDTGRFAVISDPEGALISPYLSREEPPPEPTGTPVRGTFCWDQLATPDLEGAAEFYGAIFGWTLEETDFGEAGRYRVYKRGDRDAAGLMKKPEDTPGPAFWLTYVAVADAGETAARARDLGGAVHVEPAEIPGLGRFTVAADPTGALFAAFEFTAG